SAAVQASLPELASRATSTSCCAPSISRPSRVKQCPPPTTKELKPFVLGTFQSCFGPVVGQVILSGVEPSPLGPRYMGQSVAWAVARQARSGRRWRAVIGVVLGNR